MPTTVAHQLTQLPLPEDLTTAQCWVDPEAIAKVFQHLLDNSIKFSPVRSEITLRCEKQAAQVCFSLQDQGIGIAPEQLPYIFEMFRQGDSSDTRRYGGVGLGKTHLMRAVQLFSTILLPAQ